MPQEHHAAWSTEILAREMLEAALSTPPEPEIQVSPAMARIGGNFLHGTFPTGGSPNTAASIYRAMEAQRRKEMAHPATSYDDHQHKRATDGVNAPWAHRRKDD
jgi:hypothetical protein